MESPNPNIPSHRLLRRRSSNCSLELIHLDVPLISTRRSSNPPHDNTCSPDTSRRVPFLWERVPGVPKDGGARSINEEDFFFFPPKPPPGRRATSTSATTPLPFVCYNGSEDDGNDGDVDSCSDGESEEERWVCDALDRVSLPFSSAMDCRDCSGIHRSPSFIMNRFLPAANAIAARSTPTINPKLPTRKSVPSTLSHRLQRELIKSQQQKQATTKSSSSSNAITVLQQAHPPHLPSKACGLHVFLPWTFKQTPCGHKSPVRCQQTPRPAANQISGKKNKRFSFDALRMNQRVDDNLSSKAFKSPGWGLPFLDTSRLRLRRRDHDERERGREFMEGIRGGGKPSWSLPRLQKPTEPWLSHALNNANRRY